MRALLLLATLFAGCASQAAPGAASLPSTFFWNKITRTIQYQRPAGMLVWSKEYSKYYTHTAEGKATWDVPAELAWKQETQPGTGRKFYYLASANLSQWELPRALQWEELPASELPAKMLELRREARHRWGLLVTVAVMVGTVVVWLVREQYRKDPEWLTRPPVKERKKKPPAHKSGSKFRNYRNKMSQDGKGGRSSN